MTWWLGDEGVSERIAVIVGPIGRETVSEAEMAILRAYVVQVSTRRRTLLMALCHGTESVSGVGLYHLRRRNDSC